MIIGIEKLALIRIKLLDVQPHPEPALLARFDHQATAACLLTR
jgi:hypothetical protein